MTLFSRRKDRTWVALSEFAADEVILQAVSFRLALINVDEVGLRGGFTTNRIEILLILTFIVRLRSVLF